VNTRCDKRVGGRLIAIHSSRTTWFVATFVLCVTASLSSGADLRSAFVSAHCIDCHDGETKKGGLDLTTLKLPGEDASAAARWVRIYDRVVAGEMPPKNKRQPAAADKKQFTDALAKELVAVARTAQEKDGRAAVRRMNRREYQTVLHDLLGISADVKSVLPEDSHVRGFDTISRGLETSAAHLLAYQRAADLALDAALPRSPQSSRKLRHTGRQYLEDRLSVHRRDIDPFVKLNGDALVLHARVYGDLSMQAPKTSTPGRYRLRAALRAVNTDGKPMPVLIGQKVDRFQAEKLMHIIDYRDVPADRAAVIELDVIPHSFFYFEGVTLPFFTDFQKSRGERGKQPLETDFAGPGLAIDWVEIEGPLDLDVGHRRLFGDLPRLPQMPEGKALPTNWTQWRAEEFQSKPLAAVSKNPKADAERLIRSFLPVAFRRPPTDAQVTRHVKVAHDLIDGGETFDQAIRAAYRDILCSPHFLYYIEEPGRLDDFALAVRLARFLWNSVPDEELTRVAANGSLREAKVLRAQTERMLNDAKSERFVHAFTDQWLELGKFLDMKPDAIYVEFDDQLAWSMPMETREFIREMLAHDRPVADLVHSDWTFLNSRLAKHYGVPDVHGMELRRVALPRNSRRGGVLTHAALLKLTTNGSYTSPVKRGAWILERILGKAPAPPPPDVAAVEPDIRGATTIREQLDKHKNVAVCASCHVHIDPPGFALENFDVIGGWRERYRVKHGGNGNDYVELANYSGRKVWLAKPVQADGETSDGRRFRDIDEYKQLLLADPDQLSHNMAEKLILYATGAEVDFADRAVVERIVEESKTHRHGLRSLIHAVVQSTIFQTK
jgi:hypothetical protein